MFWCHSPGARNLLCLSSCASHLHVPVAPHCKQPRSSIPVMFYTPHTALIPSFSPSIFRQHSCHARIWLGFSRQQNTAKQTKNPLVSYTNKCNLFLYKDASTILNRTYQTCCSHSNSTTLLDDLAPRSSCLISLSNPQRWHNTNCNSTSGLHLNL